MCALLEHHYEVIYCVEVLLSCSVKSEIEELQYEVHAPLPFKPL